MNSETIESNTAGVINAAALDMKLEVVIIPVSDVDRSKAFYASLGWRLDADFRFDNGFRLLQFTPAGSPCSVQFGSKLTAAEPGSARDSYLIVSDISAARSEIASRGVHISEVFHPAPQVLSSSRKGLMDGSLVRTPTTRATGHLPHSVTPMGIAG